jgi:hypothetical protein
MGEAAVRREDDEESRLGCHCAEYMYLMGVLCYLLLVGANVITEGIVFIVLSPSLSGRRTFYRKEKMYGE